MVQDVQKSRMGEPVNMGETINTTRQERLPGVSPDQKHLFFTRRAGPTQ
ncbi:hypothetical protein JW935_13265 [candidate division KSB1 bacterium]|nr:hypothetical protein [candidate division KSB1 bacterium]